MSGFNNPKEERITNDDSAITNSGNPNDNAFEKGGQSPEQKKDDNEHVPTVTPDNDNDNQGAPSDDSSSNKDQGPSGENL